MAEKRSYSPLVDYVQFKEIITGPTAKVSTLKWKVWGTDIGLPFYSPKHDALYYIFGDTFSTPFPKDGKDWRGTVIGMNKISTIKDGDFQFDSFITDETGMAKDILPSHHCANDAEYEVTKIATGGIEIKGVLYLFYESIRKWDHPNASWEINYAGVIKSADDGQTWERLHDLTWVEAASGKHVNTIRTIAEEDINMKPTGVKLDLEKRVCPAFAQIYVIPHEEYAYIYGRRGGRQHGIVVGRVKLDDFEKFDEYEYLVGYDVNNAPQWLKGTKGLKYINEHEEACSIVPKPTANMTVMYNDYLKKWLLLYYKPHVNIVMHTAETPYGPFTQNYDILIGRDYPFPKGKYIYGCNTHEYLCLEDGKIIRLILSQWTDQIYASELYEIKFK
ncbi:MAG: DUF4185 domain-containing protein [Bacilli bacterium]|jgi:hypothetical protein